MALTEIAVAVITTGPAYIAVWLTVRKAQAGPAQPQTCARAALCQQCEGRTPPDSMQSIRTAWALAV